ncbi:hypothetical protein BCR44DRAFT_43004 [Catenaria anguillulae PL171]|uniref:Uncharacterized protein n=1 Tax=Catenaria anguillulae PL171 TaxID=765915 RepID=A0A1Y2I625_9FUNG|nr:hypothetical protein BCR44DRAFT_43004 [Catenaria anguillulae PL171]
MAKKPAKSNAPAAAPTPATNGSSAASTSYALPDVPRSQLDSTTVTYHPSSDRLLVLVIAPDKPTLDSLLLRASIFYEHPTHKSTFLAQPQFAAAQAKLGKPFTYYGHNMPLTSLCAFLTHAHAARDLTPGEAHLHRTLATKLKALPLPGAKGALKPTFPTTYLVGWVKGDEPTLRHELHHAWFHFNRANYQHVCKQALESLDNMLRLQVRAYLQGCGYDEKVWVDEYQAHLGCGDQMVLGKGMELMEEAKRMIMQCMAEGGGDEWFEGVDLVANGEVY